MTSPKFSTLRRKPSVRKPIVRPVRLYLRRIRGDSMLPTLMDGQLIIFVSGRPLNVGDIVMFRHDGTEKVKRIARLESGRVWLLGDNPPASTDSRQFGWVGQENIIGNVLWPRQRPSL